MDLIETYLSELESAVRHLSRDEVRAVAEALMENWRAGRQLFLLGNGGSAATASHMMNDLNKFASVEGKRRFRAIALTDNMPLLTAVGNDQSYAEVFVEPLRNLLQPGDTLIALSGSGNSPNVLAAVEYAQANGAQVIAFCVLPGGRLAQLAQLKVIIPSDRIGQQEDGHLILNHVLCLALRERIRQEPVP